MWQFLLVFQYNCVSIFYYFRTILNRRMSRPWGVTDGHCKWHHFIAYEFLFIVHCLYRFRDKARYWSKIAIFFIPSSTWQPRCHNKRLRIYFRCCYTIQPDPRPLRWCKRVLQKFSVHSQRTRVTDRQTDIDPQAAADSRIRRQIFVRRKNTDIRIIKLNQHSKKWLACYLK